MGTTFPWFRARVGDVGVDFQPGEARLLQVRESGGRLRVTGAAWCPLAPVESGGRPEVEWGRSLRTAVASGGFAGRRCTICLPREELFMQSMKLPAMPADEIAEAVAWEAARQMNVSRDDIRADWIRIGGHAGDDDQTAERTELVAVAAHRDAIDARLEAAWAAGLRPESVETHCWALSRLYSRHHRRAADAGDCRAVLELGREGGSVLILRGDQVAFCKTMDIGGRHLDEQVADRLGLEPEAARELRAARLRDADSTAFIDPATDRAVYEAVRPLLAECAHNMLMCLRYASVTFRGLAPRKIVLTGADGAESGLAEQVASTCQVPVQRDDEEQGIVQLQEDLRTILPHDVGSIGAWAAAAGMSLRGLDVRAADTRRRTVDRSVAA